MKIKELKLLLQNYDENLEIKFPTDYEDDEQSYFSDIKTIRSKNDILYLSSLSETSYDSIKYKHENTIKMLQDLQSDFYRLYPDEECCILEKYWNYDKDFTYYFYTTNEKYNNEFYEIIKIKIWDKYEYNIQFDDLNEKCLMIEINNLRKSLDIINYHLCFEYEYLENDSKKIKIIHNYSNQLNKYFSSDIDVLYDTFNNVKINKEMK